MEFGKRIPKGIPSLAERRRTGRRPSDIDAEILLPGLDPRRSRITDLSTDGARLELATTFGLPAEFELRVNRQTYRVRVIWRRNRSVAVKFR